MHISLKTAIDKFNISSDIITKCPCSIGENLCPYFNFNPKSKEFIEYFSSVTSNEFGSKYNEIIIHMDASNVYEEYIMNNKSLLQIYAMPDGQKIIINGEEKHFVYDDDLSELGEKYRKVLNIIKTHDVITIPC